MLNKEEYKKYKNVYFNSRYELFKAEKINEFLEYKIVEDYKYSPDGSLSILLKSNKGKNELIWNPSFLSFESLEDDQELSDKVNSNFFKFFSFTFNEEWKLWH